MDLSDMLYADSLSYRQVEGCLPGTRHETLKMIDNWVNNDDLDTPRVFFLAGDAGIGKSAIAHSVARHYENINRLGSSVFLGPSHGSTGCAQNLFSTIARDLADKDSHYKASLWKAIEGSISLRKTGDPLRQFEQFILLPSTKVASTGPIVVVIDALESIR